MGGHDTFITEACEYTNSFLSFFPTINIILNIDADHLDFFKDIDDIRHSFRLFAEKLPENGILIINSDIPNYEEITKACPAGSSPTEAAPTANTVLPISPSTTTRTPPSPL